jgi:aldose sugar dehydrogenase
MVPVHDRFHQRADRSEGAAGQHRGRVSAGLMVLAIGWLLALGFGVSNPVQAQPSVIDPQLEVRAVVSGLVTPTTMAFTGPEEFLVLEKNTGQVKRVLLQGGMVQSIEVVLDLAVNFGSERGLLGIALHPDFPANPGVYLYWTESNTGTDTNVLSETPLLGNRVDRFVWNGSSLTFDHNLIGIRAIQQDADQPERGNHDGGIIRFGPDGKLYVFVGDVGRRGWMQNITEGFGPNDMDDQFGGPETTAAHLTGAILRLNDDGTTPADNPFFDAGAGIGGVVGASIQKVYSYGHRNSFGMAFDPLSGELWLQENADDAYAELNRVRPGSNGGWIQIMGPVDRVADFKFIETTMFGGSLQQVRWPPENIADTPEEALTRLFMLPGAEYADPIFSWRFEIAPAGLGFLNSAALGLRYEGDLFLGAARDFLAGGYLLHIPLSGDRLDVAILNQPGLADRVDDNFDKHTLNESEAILFGRNFGVGTDVQTGPNGNLFIVSLDHGAVYEISRKRPLPGRSPVQNFLAHLSGAEEVPPADTRAQGQAIFQLSADGSLLDFMLIVANIQNVTQAHIHVGAAGVNGPVVAWLYPDGPPSQLIPGRSNGVLAQRTITAGDLVGPLAGQPLSALLELMRDDETYVNVHTSQFPPGEIRGQIRARGPR